MTQDSNEKISLLGTIIWLLAALFFLYEFFLRNIVGSLAFQIIPELHLTAESFALLGSAYFFGYGIMQIPVGILTDKFGVKIILFFAIIACSIATLMFAYSTEFYSAFISRFLMGVGSSFAFVCLLVIAITWFPRKNFGFFAGLSQFIGTLGPLLAGGPLIEYLKQTHETWRLAMFDIAIFGFILAAFIIFIVKNKPPRPEDSLYILNKQEPFKNQLKRLFANRQAWAIAIYSATVYNSIALLGAVWGTDFLQTRGLSQTIAASMISISWVGYAIGCPLLGAISDYIKRRNIILLSASIIGFIVTAYIVYVGHITDIDYGIGFFCLGVAAAGQSVGFAAISEHVDLGTRATALGLNNALITLMTVFIPPLVGWILELSSHGQATYTSTDFMHALIIMPITYFISGIMVIFFIKESYCRPQKEPVILRVK